MRHLKVLLAPLAGLLITGCSVSEVKPKIESSILLQSSSSWDGTPYSAYPRGKPELTLLKIKIPANTVLDWHTHPTPNAAYILSGELTVETRKDGHKRLLKPGDTLAETVDIVHRGFTGEQPAELLVFYAGTPRVPLSEKAK